MTIIRSLSLAYTYSFGDGVQYPVAMKHCPGANGIPATYESMGNSCSMNKSEQTESSNHITIDLSNQNADRIDVTAHRSTVYDNIDV